MTIKIQVGRVTVELDANDSATPVMLHIDKSSATWACALDTGCIEDEELTFAELRALDGMEPEIEAFINAVKEVER